MDRAGFFFFFFFFFSSYQVIQLDGAHTLIDTRDDLLGDSSSIDMLRVEAVTQSRDTGSDLVELDAFFASICGMTRELLV